MSTSIICLLTPLLFILDICSFSFFQQPLFFSVIGLYVLSVFRPTSIYAHIMIIGFLFLESLLFFSQTLFLFWYLVPLTLISIYAKRHVSLGKFLPMACFALFLLIQSFSLANGYPCLNAPISYTFFKIIANIVLMIGISLNMRIKSS